MCLRPKVWAGADRREVAGEGRVDPARQPGQGGVIEDGAEIGPDTEDLSHVRQELYGVQRVSVVEEIVLPLKRTDTQHLGPERRQRLLGRRLELRGGATAPAPRSGRGEQRLQPRRVGQLPCCARQDQGWSRAGRARSLRFRRGSLGDPLRRCLQVRPQIASLTSAQPRPASFVFVAPGRGQAAQKVLRGLVSRRSDKGQVDLGEPSIQGLSPQRRQHAVLDPAPQHPAAQQEGVHRDAPLRGGKQHEAHQPVVAESVADPHRSAVQTVERAQLGGGPAPRGEVELVGALGQLGGALQIGLPQRLHLHLQVQAGQEGREAGRPPSDLLSRRVLLDHRCAREILSRGHARVGVQTPVVLQKGSERLRIPRKLYSEHLGQALAHLPTLDGVVVQEDEALQPETQRKCERGEVLVFGSPVDAPGREVLAADDHVRVCVEHRDHVGFVVLARQAEQHPPSLQRQQALLQPPPRRIDDHRPGAHLADHPAPEGVVAVGDHDLQRRAAQRIEPARHGRAQRGVESRGVGSAADLLGVWVGVYLPAHPRKEILRAHHAQPGKRARDFSESGLRRLECLRERGHGERVGRGRAAQDQQRDSAGCRHRQRRSEVQHRAAQSLRIGRGVRLRAEVVLGAHQDHARPSHRARQGAGRIQQLLVELVVRPETQIDRQLQRLDPPAERGEQGLGGEGRREHDRERGRKSPRPGHQGLGWRGADPLQQGFVVLDQPLRGPKREQTGVDVQRPLEVIARALQLEVQILTRGTKVNRQQLGFQASGGRPVHGHGGEQVEAHPVAVMGPEPSKGTRFGRGALEPGQRQRPVAEVAERGLADPAEQLAKAGAVGNVGAQHDGVGEQSDQILLLSLPSVGQRRQDAHLLLPRAAGQKGLPGTKQHRRDTRLLLSRERLDRRAQAAVQHHRAGGCAADAPRRARLIGREAQAGPPALEAVAPVAQQRVKALGLQPGALQGDDAREVAPRWVEGARAPRHPVLIEPEQIGKNNLGRARIGGDVVGREHQHVVVGSAPDEQRAERAARAQIEERQVLADVDLGQPTRLLIGSQRPKVDLLERDGARLVDGLRGGLTGGREGDPQRLVPRRDGGERVLQRGPVQRTAKANRHGQVVGRVVQAPVVQLPKGRLIGRNGQGLVLHGFSLSEGWITGFTFRSAPRS